MRSLVPALSRDARGRGDRFVAAHPRPHEVLDAYRDRSFARGVDHEQGLDALEVPVDRGADQIAAVGDVAIDRPQRYPRAGRDPFRRRAQVTLGEQLEHGVEHGDAVAVAARGAAVEVVVVDELTRVGQHLTVSMS